MDGNEELEELLTKHISSVDMIAKLAAEISNLEASAAPDESTPLLQDIYTKGKLARDASQFEFAHGLIQNILAQVPERQTFAKVVPFIQSEIAEYDTLIETQLNEVLHQPAFQQLEAAWRGLHFLVSDTETSTRLKIRLFNISKHELLKDLI